MERSIPFSYVCQIWSYTQSSISLALHSDRRQRDTASLVHILKVCLIEGYRLDYFLAPSSDFLNSLLLVWQPHSNSKSSGSRSSQPRSCLVGFGWIKPGNGSVYIHLYDAKLTGCTLIQVML